MPGKRHRWEFMLMPQDDAATITRPESVYALLAPWNIDPDKSKIERAVVYTFHSALATRWRRDRLLLAGDSAHQTPPFLGQGMCSGLRDAANLAWKLRDVITGRAPDFLLDTYESERMEHVRAFIELAVELGGVIQTTDPEKARQRDRELVANPTMLRPITPRLGPGLHGDAPTLAGARAAQPRLADGGRLDDRVGYRFALLATARLLDTLPKTLRKQLDDMDIVVVTAERGSKRLSRPHRQRRRRCAPRPLHSGRGIDAGGARRGHRPHPAPGNERSDSVAGAQPLPNAVA